MSLDVWDMGPWAQAQQRVILAQRDVLVSASNCPDTQLVCRRITANWYVATKETVSKTVRAGKDRCIIQARVRTLRQNSTHTHMAQMCRTAQTEMRRQFLH